jgi:tetratricopeptide (TPR) repeat protein
VAKRQSICFAIAFVIVASLCAPQTAHANPAAPPQYVDIDPLVKSQAARPFVAQAKKAYRSGNPQLGMMLLRKAVNAAPKDGIVRLLLGRILLQMDYAGAAEREVRQARRDGAPDNLALPTLLQAMLAQHEEQGLLNEFPDPGANAKGSVGADILKGRAQALAALGHVGDAAPAMDRSLSLRRDVPGLLVRAQIAGQQGDVALQKGLTDEAYKLDPLNIRTLRAKVDLFMAANDNGAALEVNGQMVKEYPRNLAAWLTRVELLQRLNEGAQAKAAMEKVIAMAPGTAVARYFQALLTSKTDNHAAWRIAQTLSPEFANSSADVALQIGQMAIASGYVETGAAIFSAALVKWPDALDLRLRLARVRLDQNSPDAALTVLAPVKDSSDPKVMDLLVQAHLKAGNEGQALAVLDRLQTANPKGAVEHLTRAHGMRPADGEITFRLVRALDASGSRDTARDLLKSLLSSHVNFVELPDARKLAVAWHLQA